MSPEKDGSKPVDGSYRCDIEGNDGLVSESNSHLENINTIFSGRPGAISQLRELAELEGINAVRPALLAALISEELPLHVISNIAFMFNFHDILSLSGGSPKLCIQLADTTSDNSRYTSAWSSGFGLESVGVTQIVG